MIQASAHNDIIQVAATMGLVGLIAYLACAWSMARTLTGPALAAFVALFVQAKFQPVPPQGLLVLALLAGRQARTSPLSPRAARWTWGIGLVALVLCLALSIVSWHADAAFARGMRLGGVGRLDQGAAYLRRANELAPWNILYAARRCEAIWKLAPHAGMERGGAWLMRALDIARQNAAMHAADPGAHELAATAYLMASGGSNPGALREAAREIAKARELDGNFIFSWNRTRKIALLMGDMDLAARAEKEVARIENLRGQP